MIRLVDLTELALEVDVYGEVEVAIVPGVRLHGEVAVYLLALLHRHVLVEVEDRLLPVRVLGLGGGAEAHALVALGELDVEERHEGLHIVVPAHLEDERRREGQIGFAHRVQIDFLDHAGVGHDLDKVQTFYNIVLFWILDCNEFAKFDSIALKGSKW